MKKNIGYMKNVNAMQGDALDLSRFDDNSFDVTLLLGPMYHLFSKEDQHKALDEAIRVTKTDGVILVAFLSVHAVLYSNFLKGNFEAGLKINLDENYKPTHYDNQVFTAFEVSDFEQLFEGKNDTLQKAYNVTKDRYLKKKVHEGIFTILWISDGLNNFELTDEAFFTQNFPSAGRKFSQSRDFVFSNNSSKVSAENSPTFNKTRSQVLKKMFARTIPSSSQRKVTLPSSTFCISYPRSIISFFNTASRPK